MSKLLGAGILIAIVLSLVSYSMSGFAYVPVVNNTNLAPTIEPTEPGTGERISGVNYHNNNSQIDLYVYAHASAAGDTATVAVYINGRLVQNQSGRPLAAPEQTWRSVPVTVPIGSVYNVTFSNYHHYVWIEYPYVFKKMR